MKRREEGRWDQAWGGIASLGLALPILWTGMWKTKPSFGENWPVDGRGAGSGLPDLKA